jgi:hypothetical protein
MSGRITVITPDQRSLWQPPLQDGVRRDRGAMQEGGNITELEANLLARELETRDQPLGGVIGGGRRFEGLGLARGFVEDLDIGECAADVDGDADRTGRRFGLHERGWTSKGLTPRSRPAPFCRK